VKRLFQSPSALTKVRRGGGNGRLWYRHDQPAAIHRKKKELLPPEKKKNQRPFLGRRNNVLQKEKKRKNPANSCRSGRTTSDICWVGGEKLRLYSFDGSSAGWRCWEGASTREKRKWSPASLPLGVGASSGGGVGEAKGRSLPMSKKDAEELATSPIEGERRSPARKVGSRGTVSPPRGKEVFLLPTISRSVERREGGGKGIHSSER